MELPEGCYPEDVERRIVGRVESVDMAARAGGAAARVTISYAPDVAGGELPQLLNLVYGNVSLYRGVRVVGLDLPDAVLRRYPGPQYGIEGLRQLVGAASGRPLVCGTAKPVGLSAEHLARLCGIFARAGMDLVKDDHGLAADAPNAAFAERVRRSAEAVARANAETGGCTVYLPNVTGAIDRMEERVGLARDLGCRAVLVAPLVVGLDTVRWIAQAFGLAVFAHPTFTGGFFQPGHGIAPDVLYGTLFRLAGADGVIFTPPGGRFPLSEETGDAIVRRLRSPLGDKRPAMPVAGGGVDAAHLHHWIERYGADVTFLVGSSLYAADDLEAAARRLVAAVRG